MLDLGSGVAGGARGWVVGRAGLWGCPTDLVVGVSPQILEHPTSICDTGVKLYDLERTVQWDGCLIWDLGFGVWGGGRGSWLGRR